jgi:hypothetical protein
MPVTELEKKSLEMHVELAALREKTLKDSLDALDKKISDINTMHQELKQLVDGMKDKRNDQLLKWGATIIIGLFSALSALLIKIILPIILKSTWH